MVTPDSQVVYLYKGIHSREEEGYLMRTQFRKQLPYVGEGRRKPAPLQLK